MDKSKNTKTMPESLVASVSVSVRELRVGNLIHYNGSNEDIGKISLLVSDLIDDLSYCQINYRRDKKHWMINLRPVEITEGWLIEFGFKKSKESEWYNLPDFQIGIVVDENNDFVFCVVEGMVLKHIKYIHQLQNLYFAIKGLELQDLVLTEH